MIVTIATPSTTHIDRHFERFAKSALDQGAEQINSRYIPVLRDHDFNQRLGVNLCAIVKPLGDGHHALVVVAGLYESSDEYLQFPDREKNTLSSKYLPLIEQLDLSDVKAKPSIFPDKRPETMADWLELHLDSTSILPDGRVYKVKHKITSIGDLLIEVYPQDHDPEHFHVISKQRSINARFDLRTLEVISHKQGQISRKDEKKIKAFFKQFPHFLDKLRIEHKRLQG